MDVADSPRLLLVLRPGLCSTQQRRQDDCFVHPQICVEMETVAVPDGVLQTANGMAGFESAADNFVVDYGAAGEGGAQIHEDIDHLHLGSVHCDFQPIVDTVGWRLVHNHRPLRFDYHAEVLAGGGENIYAPFHVPLECGVVDAVVSLEKFVDGGCGYTRPDVHPPVVEEMAARLVGDADHGTFVMIRACSCDPLVTPPTESLISVVKRLFGFDFALEEFNFQVGDLLNAVAKICQNSTSARLPSEVSKLCFDLATIFCCHPRMHLILSCIDRIACLMLRRPENWWRTAGCRLISCISVARCNVLQTFAASYIHLTPCLSSSELFAFTNVSDQEYRSTTYLRLLTRQLRLTEGAISNATELRMHLLLACANFLKDLQYTAFVTPLIFRNTSTLIKLHPFLRSAPLPSTELDGKHDASLTASSAASVLHSAWMLPDAELRTNPTANASFTSFSSAMGKSSEKGKITDEHGCVDDFSADYVALQTRQLAIYIINEGLRFLDELLHSPKYETVLGLIYVVRCLRVFAETKGPTFFLNRKQLTSSGYTQSQQVDFL
ncbi:hypothetical protein SprV_0200812100 [Sparganum proliferum]